MYMIEITEDKLSNLTNYAEKMPKYGSKVMKCLEELEDESSKEGFRRGRRDDDEGRSYNGYRQYPRY